MLISKEFTFEASHVLPKHPGKCSRLHGHSWKLTVTVEGSVDEKTGFVVDYGLLKACVDTHIIDKLDHTHLGQYTASHAGSDNNAWPYFGYSFYPSSENLVRAIAKVLQPLIKELRDGIRLYEVTLNETCTSAARWRASEGFI